MKSKTMRFPFRWQLLALSMLLLVGGVLVGGAVYAQTPVDDDGKPLGPVYSDSDEAALNDAEIALLSATELEVLVGPIALYPDDLLAIVLPASTYPLEIVQAARYLEQLEKDSSLQPDDAWDDSVVALLNYPEALQMMSDDIDWTWQLGEAVVAQQGDVVAAVESFRDRAYAAGNLKSDERQTVTRNTDDIIQIDPIDDDVIYVPYYEPERVVVYQTRPVYHYYPRAYPVYYYPYPAGYNFSSGYFWGVTTAFRIGWSSDHLHVFHHSYRGHPYFGWNYYGNYWRRPTVQVFNTWYGSWGYRNNRDHYRYGSYWRPRQHGGARPGAHPGRDRYYSNRRRSYSEDGYAEGDRRNSDRRRRGSDSNDAGRVRGSVSRDGTRSASRNDPPRQRDDIRFRSRESRVENSRRSADRRREPDGARTQNDRSATRRGVAPEGRSNPRPAAVRRDIGPEDVTNRRGPRQQFARRETDSRNSNTVRRPTDAARRSGEATARRAAPSTVQRRTEGARRSGEVTPRRAAPSSIQRRQAEPRPHRAPAPRNAVPQRRSAPAVRQRAASAPPAQRSLESPSRTKSTPGKRKASSARSNQGSKRNSGDRRRRD